MRFKVSWELSEYVDSKVGLTLVLIKFEAIHKAYKGGYPFSDFTGRVFRDVVQVKQN